MAVSAGGLITFLILVVVGPVCLLVYDRLSKRRKAARGEQDDAPTTDQNGREVVTNVEYMLGLLGYAIGIGNLWRFPFLCGRNGGAAFLVAYFSCLLLVSLPAYMIEMVMGQYTRKSTIGCFGMIHPIWRGVGWAQAFMLFWVIAYYNVLLGYACIYVIGSLSDPMPWEPETAQLGGSASATYWNEDVLNRFPAEDQGPNGLGPLSWKTSIALLAVWIIVFFAIAFGKKVLAKVTWVTVVGPVLMLVVLLFRVAFLNASDEGVAFYIGKFDGSKLGEIGVWRDACVQILFSLSPGMGTAITMSSFTKPKENVYKTCLIVAFCNSAFSFVGGFAIFSIVGNITYKINYQTLSDLIESTKITAASFAQKFGTDVVSKAQDALAALPASAQVATAAAKQTFEQDVQGALRMLNETAFSSVLMGRQIPNVDMNDFTVTTSQASAANDLSEYTSLANYIQSLGNASVAAAATASTALLGIVLSEEQHHNNGQLELAASTTREAIGQLLAVANTQALHDQAMLNTGTNLTLADETGMLQSIAETARAGPGLAFIAIADGMQTFGGFKNVMAVLFFMTLLTLGLDSTFAWAETLVSYVDDGFRAAGKPQKKIVPVGIVCAVMFLFGLPFCTRMGNELLDTVDNYVGLMFLLFGVFVEGIIFAFSFRYDRFVTAVRTACGVNMGVLQKGFWGFATHFSMPVVAISIFIWNFVTACEEPYEGYPDWMQGIGWFLLAVCLLLIPAGAIAALVSKSGGSTLDTAPGASLVDGAKESDQN